MNQTEGLSRRKAGTGDGQQGDQPVDGDDSIIWFYHSYRMHTPNSPFGYSFGHDSSTLLEKGRTTR